MSVSQYVSPDEYKQQKALEEARKAGKIPAQVDAEGKEINPHMPQYITVAPWYLDTGAPSMRHQYFFKGNQASSDEFYARGQKGFQATKYRKGACTNCGAITHQANACCERPRRKGAALTNKDIQADDIIKDIKFTYDSKRHNWNGYNPDDYMEIVRDREKIEEKRKEQKEKQLEQASLDGEDKYDDGTRQKDEKAGMVKSQVEQASINSSTPNLRIREDSAKYLRNLSEDSAYFNPKGRSMRENPTPNDPNALFKGENELRNTGGAVDFIRQEKFAWDAVEKDGLDLSSIANPTLTEKVFKEMQAKELTFKSKNMAKIFNEYGGEEHFQGDMDLILGQTEKYAEYAADGSTLDIYHHRRSKYIEDQYINNHTAVWGSYYNDLLGWGFACCHTTTKSSMCSGEKGKKEALMREYKEKKRRDEEIKRAKEISAQEKLEQKKALAEQAKKAQEESINEKNSSNNKPEFAAPLPKKKIEEKQDTKQKTIKSKKDEKIDEKSKQKKVLSSSNPFQWGGERDEDEEDRELDQDKLNEAIKRIEERQRMTDDQKDERKRKYNSLGADESYEISKEDIEAFNMKKKVFEDPMANYKDEN